MAAWSKHFPHSAFSPKDMVLRYFLLSALFTSSYVGIQVRSCKDAHAMPSVVHVAALKIVVETERKKRKKSGKHSRFEKYLDGLVADTKALLKEDERAAEHAREWRLHYHSAPPQWPTSCEDGGDPYVLYYYDSFAYFLNQRIVQTHWFDGFIFLNIIAVGIATGLELNGAGDNSRTTATVLYLADWATFWVFIGEALLKIIACGSRPWLYFTSQKDGAFNCFDFALVLMVRVAAATFYFLSRHPPPFPSSLLRF